MLRASAVLIPLWLLLAPLMAYALGDLRVLPSLWVFTPCLAVLGLSAVYNGFCYGLGRAWPPALSEMLEQALRFLLAAGLLLTLPQASVAWRAAMPGVATSIAEAAGLVLILSLLRRETASPPDADYAALLPEFTPQQAVTYVNIGLDRLVMMRYGVDDVRLFHSADLRFLNQFR